VISGAQVRVTDGETATTETVDRIPLFRMSFLLHCFRMSEAQNSDGGMTTCHKWFIDIHCVNEYPGTKMPLFR
jgi:hypothetical protein